MNRNPNPDCEQDCRFAFGPTTITDMYFPPIYDKNGNNTNPDCNTASGTVSCYTCNKIWSYTRQYGEPTAYTEVVK